MIEPIETHITGNWIFVDGTMRSDENEKRVQRLITTYLEEIGKDGSGWQKLYRDPSDGRYWELNWPRGEVQGGGPMELRIIEKRAALEKFTLYANPNP